uniref:hypothetical protein n=1 Tax=Geobacillus sp. (strain Y412MC10) TaxID=481743 RepID=UPI001C92E459
GHEGKVMEVMGEMEKGAGKEWRKKVMGEDLMLRGDDRGKLFKGVGGMGGRKKLGGWLGRK